jgi:hypothetical protein
MLYRKRVYTENYIFGVENDYTNSERGQYWKKQLKDCIVSAIGYALGLRDYGETTTAFAGNLGDSCTYMEQMEALLGKARRVPRLVFEVGSGRGELAAALTASSVPCIASDFMDGFDRALDRIGALWGVKPEGLNVDFVEASRLMRDLKPDTVILCETIEHIPRKEFEEAWGNTVDVLSETGGLFILTNWVHFHPIPVNGNDHIWEINDQVYDWLASYGKTVYRNGSHLVLSFKGG